jgi:hypothetical protein
LLLWNLQPFATPDSFDSILAYSPPGSLQQRRDAPVSVASILARQCNDRLGESIFVFTLCRVIAMRTAWLLHQSARSALAHALLLRMLSRTTASLRA